MATGTNISVAEYDVVVVGGGPAGAATATHLARAGHSVCLLDRAIFPRDKACGEFFSPPVRGLLTTLGVYDEVLRHHPQTLVGAQVHCAGKDCVGKNSVVSFTGGFSASANRSRWATTGGFSLPRTILDNLLWQNAVRAGAEVRTGVTLRGLLRDGDKIIGVQTDRGAITARVVVGADGSRSRVAREMGAVRELPHLQKLALVSHYANVKRAVFGNGQEFAPPLVEMHMVEMHMVEMHLGNGRHVPGAVCGWGPGPGNTLNLTLVVGQGQAAFIAAQSPADYADNLLQSDFPHLHERLITAQRTSIRTCGTFGHVANPVGDGVLLVGDAATFIDPFTGEGVYFALRGAELAAQTIDAALRRGDTSAHGLRAYRRARQMELAPKYAVCDLVQRVVGTPALIQPIVRRMGRRPHLAESLLSVTGDMASPYRLLRPDFWWGLATA